MHIGSAQFDEDAREIRCNGMIKKIEPRAAELLRTLAASPGAVLSREALLDACWPHDGGSDEALTQAIAQLRRALGDSATAPAFIQTVPKTGYRLIAPVNSRATGMGREKEVRAPVAAESAVALEGRRHPTLAGWTLIAAAVATMLAFAVRQRNSEEIVILPPEPVGGEPAPRAR